MKDHKFTIFKWFCFIGFAAIIVIALSSCKSEETIKTTVTEKANLSWNNQEWSGYVYEAINDEWSRLSKSKDMSKFCDKYDSLEDFKKRQIFADLIVQMSFYESSWNPKTRYFEKTMGYYSEGLMQLSVNDQKWTTYCNLTEKSILEPKENLTCAIKILARQVEKHGRTILPAGKQYWAVILENGRYQKIEQIKNGVIAANKECL